MTLTPDQQQIILECSRDSAAAHKLAALFDAVSRQSDENQQRERFINHILATTPIVVYIYDLQAKRNIYINQQVRNIMGYQLEDLPVTDGSILQALAHEEDRDEVSRQREQLTHLADGQAIEFDYRIRHMDGSWRWVHAQESIFARSADGTPLQVLGVALDVTRRREAEDTLRLNEHRFRALFENTTDAIFMIGLDRQILAANQCAVTLLGYSLEELIGLDATRLTDPGERHEAERFWTAVMAGDSLPVYERTFIHRSGKRIFAEVNLALVRDADGRPMHVQSVVRDITARKRAEDALRESESYFRTIINTVQEGVWIIDDRLKTLYVNEFLADMLGYSRQVMVDSPLLAFLDDESRVTVAKLFRRRVRNVRHLDVRFIRADGAPLWAMMSVTALYDAGRPFGSLVMVTDITNRKQAEAALRMANAYNRGLIEASLDPLITISTDGLITDVNVATERITGCSRQTLKNTDFASYFTQPEQARDAYQRVFEEGNVKDCELAIRHRDGRVRSVLFNAAVYRNEDEHIVGVVAAVRDISDRKRMEETLRQTIAHNQALLNAVPDMIVRMARGGRYLDIKPAADFPPMRPPDELLHLTTADVMPPALVPSFLARIEAALQTGKMQFAEYTLHERGDDRVYESRMVRCSDDEVISIVRDITDRKRAEESLRENEERFRAIFESAAVGIAISDANGDRLGVNPALQKMLGYDFDELYRMSFLQITHPDDLPRELPLIEELRAGQRGSYQLEKRYRRKDGSYFWARASSSLIRQKTGEPRYGLVTVEDIHESRLAAQKELELAAERERVRILANFIQDAAHEFRTPLSIINTSAYLLGRVPDADTQTAHLSKISLQVKNITALVDNLLTLSRLDTDPTLRLRLLNLNDILSAAEVALGVPIGEKRHEMRHALADPPPLVEADAEKLHAALMNILYNAVRFTPAGGTITLRTYRSGAEVVAEVQDNGIGIKSEALKLIFNRFYREDVAHSTPGFGLGLPIARKIVEYHRGRIEVESTPQQGSTFRVVLPAHQE